MTRGKKKRLLRQATQMRIRAERDALTAYLSRPDYVIRPCRMEEDGMLKVAAKVPSAFAFAEKLNSRYERPLWASQRYGAK